MLCSHLLRFQTEFCNPHSGIRYGYCAFKTVIRIPIRIRHVHTQSDLNYAAYEQQIKLCGQGHSSKMDATMNQDDNHDNVVNDVNLRFMYMFMFFMQIMTQNRGRRMLRRHRLAVERRIRFRQHHDNICLWQC
jgi:hypothetical protein